MKPKNRYSLLILTYFSVTFSATAQTSLFWDGGNVNIAGNGNGASTYTSGTWSTSVANWDQGSSGPRIAWNNANNDTAIFGGSYSVGAKTITIGSNITVNQIQVLTGSTAGNRYDIGASATQSNFAITFGGNYGPSFHSITGSDTSFLNNQFNAKVTGTPTGGLWVSHGSNPTTPETSGRLAFLNSNNDFVGDLVLAGGMLSVATVHQYYGNAANKLVLRGGSLFLSGGAAISVTLPRNIDVATASGISTNATTAGLQSLDFTGTITGAANLTRYSFVAGATTISDVRFSGDMSGYTGTIENTGGTAANNLMTIQTTATSGGAWKITGGTLKLNTTDDTHIANSVGKADLLMNGGTLDMNGKNETINGLSGTVATSFVQNQAGSSTSTLTLGDADTSASFAGAMRDNSGTGGTLALTKIGTGTQTLTGTLTHTGATNVNAGTLLITNATGTPSANSAFTLANSATLGVQVTGTGPSSVTMASLTTGSAGAGSTLTFPIKGFPLSSSTPLVNCLGSLAPGTAATTLIKLNGYDFSTGQYSLIQYGSLDGAGLAGFDIDLPYRVEGTLVNNTVDPLFTSIDLNITSADTAIWTGDVSGTPNGNWDINPDADGSAGTFNWITSISETPTRYAQGPTNTDQVTFDDSAIGTTTVNLTTTLTPRHVRVKNSSAKTYTFTGTGKLSGDTQLEKDSDGTLIIANTALNDYTGGTIVRDGILRLGDGATTGAGQLSGSISVLGLGTLAFFHPDAVTAPNPITGGGKVLKLGTNTLTLDASSGYSGGTTISTGTLAASTSTALGTGMVTLGDAATGSSPVELTLNNRSDISNAILISTAGTGSAILSATNTGTGTTNPASFTGTVTLERDTTFRSDIVGDNLAFTGKITSPADPAAPINLTISGGQTVNLESTANDFRGDILVRGAGTSLQARVSSEVIPNNVRVDLATGTFFKLAVTTETISRLTGTGTVERSTTGTSTLVVGSGDADSTFDGVIRNGSGTVILRKSGTGTFTLTNTHSYTGATQVQGGGTLVVNGTITSASAVSAGTLAGIGTVGAITTTGTGKVSPGTNNTIGTLSTTGNVSFATGTEYTAQINSNGTPSSDRLTVTGTLGLGAGVATLNLTDLGSTTLSTTTKLVLATATGTITGTFKDSLNNPLPNDSDVVIGSNTYKIKYNDTVGPLNAITLTYTASGYGSWATLNGVGAANVDHENDGVQNGVEYVLGTDPKAASTTGITTTVTPTEFQFTFTRSDASETPDTVLTIEVSNDLINWNANGSPFTVGATSSGSINVAENPAAPAADPGTDTITLTVPRDTTTKFARIKVNVTP